MESTEPKTARKKFSSQKKKKKRNKDFYLAFVNYRETARAFNFRIPLIVIFVKQHP